MAEVDRTMFEQPEPAFDVISQTMCVDVSKAESSQHCIPWSSIRDEGGPARTPGQHSP